jgi:hypothetical protein
LSTKPMTVRVRSVPPCVSSQIGSRHLPLKQGIPEFESHLAHQIEAKGKSKKSKGGSHFAVHTFCLCTFSFLLFFGVWCNASIRVLGTRGDSSILSTPTTFIAKFQLPIFDWPFHSRIKSAIANQKSAMPLAPVAQLEECDASNVEVAGSSPARSPNLIWRKVDSLRVPTKDLTPQPSGGGYPKPAPHERRKLTACATSGSDVAGNMRVFQTRFESSNLSFRSNLRASPSG